MSAFRRSVLLGPALLALSSFGAATAAAQGLTTSQERVNMLFTVVLGFAIAIGVFVGAMLLVTVLKFRMRKGHTKPVDNVKTGDHRLEAAWTIIPALILLLVGILAFQTLAYTDTIPQNPDVTVTIIGHQWYWEFWTNYTNGTSIQSIGKLTLKANETVKVIVKGADVIHTFYIPAFGFKIDAIPGHDNVQWFKPTQPGTYDIKCTQYCGVNHYAMVGTLTVLPG